MVNKELRRLSRRELVDIIFQMKRNEEKLQEKIVSLKAALEIKRIKIAKAGSIADVAAEITQVFSAAQATADLYLREITAMKEDAAKECAEIIKEAKERAKKIEAREEDKNSD